MFEVTFYEGWETYLQKENPWLPGGHVMICVNSEQQTAAVNRTAYFSVSANMNCSETSCSWETHIDVASLSDILMSFTFIVAVPVLLSQVIWEEIILQTK